MTFVFFSKLAANSTTWNWTPDDISDGKRSQWLVWQVSQVRVVSHVKIFCDCNIIYSCKSEHFAPPPLLRKVDFAMHLQCLFIDDCVLLCFCIIHIFPAKCKHLDKLFKWNHVTTSSCWLVANYLVIPLHHNNMGLCDPYF